MTSRIMFSRAEGRRQQPIGMSSNGRTADSGSVNGGSTPSIPAIVCCVLSLLARSSSGSGRRPLKAEITGSNPVRATKSFRDTPIVPLYMARSSSGSGRRPLKAEITSSNLVRATKSLQAGLSGLFCFSSRLPHLFICRYFLDSCDDALNSSLRYNYGVDGRYRTYN